MSIHHKSCLVCNSQEFQDYFITDDFFVSGKTFPVLKCHKCGFVFTQDIPAADEIGPYYKSEDYISHSNTQKGLVNKIYHSIRNIMLERKYRLINGLIKGKDLLDIGCGTGYFPHFMQHKGYSVSGMEMDSDARKFALENFGLSVYSPENLLTKTLEKKYDVITLWHVLEHLHEADKYMEWIISALKDDGVLILALPNCDSFDAGFFKGHWAAYDVPRHLWHFTPESLENYITKCGFKLEKIKRLPFDAYYNSLLSSKYKGSKPALLVGFVIGFISNVISFFNKNKASSVIYILRKK